MNYPCLILEQACKTDISLELDREGVSRYGDPLPKILFTGKCNYQDRARTILTAEKKLVEITGTALFRGDICPELPVISGGTACLFGATRRVLQGRKARNMDGSVNYTEVLLI